MVEYASFDEAFNNHDMAATLKKQQQQIDSGRPITRINAPNALSCNYNGNYSSSRKPSSQNKKRIRNGKSNNNNANIRHGLLPNNDLLPRGVERPMDSTSGFASADHSDPLSCHSFYRGCNIDDVENVMDIYTGDLNFDKDTCRKNPEHRRKMKRVPQDMMMPAANSPVQPSDETSTSALGASSPFIYDGMSPVDMPFKPYDNEDLAHSSARYDDVRLSSDPETGRRPMARNQEEDELEDDDEEDADEEDEDAVASAEAALNKKRKEAAAIVTKRDSEREAQENDLANTSTRQGGRQTFIKDEATSYVLEIALYVVTGILLIFVMEQFVQIGVNIGRSGAF
jgi:hypothetical protein